MKPKVLFPLLALLMAVPVFVSCDERDSPYPFNYDFYISYDCLRKDSVKSMHVAIYKDVEKVLEEEIGLDKYDGGPRLILGAGAESEYVKEPFTYVYYISAPSVPSWAGRTDTLVASFDKHCNVLNVYYNGIDMRNRDGDIFSENGLYKGHVTIHVTK